MLIPDTFIGLLDRFRTQCKSVEVLYNGPPSKISAAVTTVRHRAGSNFYGVYVVQTSTARRDVLYIGKGGTLQQSGTYGSQDVLGRLTATEGKSIDRRDITADQWFGEIVLENGPIVIECFAVPSKLSPALAEALLLQTYLNDNGKLPRYNKCL